MTRFLKLATMRFLHFPLASTYALLLTLPSALADDDPPQKEASRVNQSLNSSPPHNTINEWQSFREDELRRLERRQEDAKNFSKFSTAALSSLAPAISPVRPSTVEFLDGSNDRVCYGIVVDPAGHILTKASEVTTAGDQLRCRFMGGITMNAIVTDMFQPYDLALVKVGASGLTSVNWELAASEDPGTFVVAPGIQDIPLCYGVLSVSSRKLNPGFLGVQLAPGQNGALVYRILPQSAALAAGIKSGDKIVEVEGIPIPDRETLIETVKKFSNGDEIKLKLFRKDAELEMMILLGSRLAAIPDPNHQMLSRMDVRLSANRIDYPSALQHDLPLDPSECGGPLVNLDGQVIGMNIARAGRIRSLAIPAADLAPLLNATSEGRFSIPDPEALGQQLAAARLTVKHAEASLASAQTKVTNLERALDNLKKYRLPKKMEEPVADRSSDQEDAISAPPDGDGGETDPQPVP